VDRGNLLFWGANGELGRLKCGFNVLCRTMPEEINRVPTDAIAEYLFVTEEAAVANLMKVGIHPQLRMISPIGYPDSLCLPSKATVVLTDFGGIQEETTALGIPCLTQRENTARPVTISEETNLLVGTNPVKIVAAAREMLAGKGKSGRIPPLWDGHAARRIVEILLRLVPRKKHPN